ncbi:hypothetical protein D3C72_2349550 [compost metagenome]
MQAQRFEIFGLFGIGKLRQLAFDLRGDDDHAGAIGMGIVLDGLAHGIAGSGGGLVDIADIEHGL